MSERKYFGTDGIRGKVGDSPITPDFVLKLGWAAGKVLARHGSRKIIIGKDTRISGYMLESALEAGLGRCGVIRFFHRSDADAGGGLSDAYLPCRGPVS
ncbi:Phosphoglucosamine mutase [Serratia plymuthica]|uniref:Phosphoglucosamine mutase n=1 Tax=Serratia plymuthica TaxID=82996 RepID=A0A2X4TVC2_SERPL|nr:Phosphoglucosamine mutase [Serratia plymuthica]